MASPASFTKLSDQQRIYVECRLKGMSATASATAAGYKNAGKNGSTIEHSPTVQAALKLGREVLNKDIEYTRKEAHEMLMESYRNAGSAAEQVMATRELIRLHGVQAEQTVKHKHEHVHKHDLTLLPDKDLLELAQLPANMIIDGEFTEVVAADEHEG